ncbi:MAG: beta-galactosidase [Armatimonadetes bacterium]|nr:beta-galactosidase [Armatimonadota bacterium]
MRPRSTFLSAALASATLLAMAAWAATPAEEVEEDCSLASSLVTPHKPWGKPLPGGPVRTLFFIYTGPYDGTWEDTGTRVREAVELLQRFDLQADAVLYCGSGEKWFFHGQKHGENRAERLLARPYALYVVAGFPFGKLPGKFRYLVLSQVVKGAGLVCCGPGAAEYMTPQRQFAPTPPGLLEGLPLIDGRRPEDVVKAYRLGQGRGVWLNYNTQSLTPWREFSYAALADYDYWMLWIGRAALWAAGREGDLGLTFFGGQPLEVSQAQSGQRAEVSLSNRGNAAAAVKVAFELQRAGDGQKTSLGEAAVTVPAGQSATVPVVLPRLRAGEYFLDAVVRSGRGVEVSGAGNVKVTSDFGLEKVELGASFVERSETITGKAILRGQVPPNSILRIRLRDSYDRILQQQDVQVRPGQTEYPFTYRADACSTILMRAEAVLMADGQEVEMKQASFTVPKRRHGQHNFVMWDMARDPLAYYAWRQLQQAGFNVCLIGSMGSEPTPQPEALKACDASLVPYSTRILDPKDENGHMLPVCWNDDPAAAEYVRGIVSRQKFLREQGVFVYSLGDEGVTMGCCVHPACIAAYRRWLAAQYGTIEALNASWGTEYSSFDEVDLLDRKDNMETAAARACFPRWYDRQAFARYNLMQFSARFVREYSQLDPQAKTGFEGTGGFGDDYDLICGINTFYGPYPSIGDDIIRSIYPRDRVRSNWMGYSKTGDALSDAAWRMVIKGMDSVWFWMWSGIGSWRGYLRPTLDFWPATVDLTAEMKPVREGLGDLLLASQPLHSGIAFFYSLPSALSCQLEGNAGFAAAQQVHETLVQMTYELGLDFRYVTSGTLKAGALRSGEFKVLVLPSTQALSADEAAEIRRFVETGGTVIADVRPGVFDAHCKPLLPGCLDDLFGITRTGRGKAANAPLSVKAALGKQTFSLNLTSAKVDQEVQPSTAGPLGKAGEAPVLLVNRVGAGRAILLNFQPLPAGEAEAASLRALLQALYADAGARSAVTFTAPSGGPLPQTETRIWRTGDALVFGLLRRMECAWFGPTSGTIGGPPQPARITLPGPCYVYDLRARKFLGRVSRVDTVLRWGRANFFLAAPYPVRGLKVTLSQPNPRPGEAFTANLGLDIPKGAKEHFAAWVEVLDPANHTPLWGRQAVILSEGRGQVPLRLAYNDAAGKWRIRATELFSGQSAEAVWTVR